MQKRGFVFLAFAAITWAILPGRPTVCPAADSTAKINLRIYYVGRPGSDREKDFGACLGQHFVKVSGGDLSRFDEAQARDFDVVILDYDGPTAEAPRPKLGADYKHPTVTVGILGGQLGREWKLKTAYG